MTSRGVAAETMSGCIVNRMGYQAAGTINETFGQRVRDIRQQLGLSQRQVATMMASTHGTPWHQTTVAKTETGERPVKLSEAVALATAFGVPVADLLADAGPQNAAQGCAIAARGEFESLIAHIERIRARLSMGGMTVDEVRAVEGVAPPTS